MIRRLALLIPILPFWISPCETAALELQIQGQTLTATSALGSVAFFGVAREIGLDDVVTRRRTVEIRPLENRQGTVALDIGRPVAPASVWIAVDLTNGEFATARPDGTPVELGTFPVGGIGRAPGATGAITDFRAQGELLVARPGVGVWTLMLGDGSAEDRDGMADGKFEASLDQLTPLGDAPPPPLDFAVGDTVLLIDPRSLEIIATRIEEGE